MSEKGSGARSRTRVPVVSQEEGSEDSYDEQNELTRVKIGKVPYGWYDDLKNFGYDNKLQPVLKSKKMNKLQEFIKKSENKDWWRTIRDQLNMRDVVLTDQQLALIDRIRSGKMASQTIAKTDYTFQLQHNDPFPIHAHPPAKRNFMPSKWERMKVNKILDGLLSGRIPWNQQQESEEQLYDVWASGTVPERGVINIAPMKQKLPGHNESYHPPKQFLLTPEQLKEWEQMDEEDRPFDFIPSSYSKIRKTPFYDKLIQERFQRCLDLYLCPRVKKKKLNIDPDTLIPKLPDPKLLKPFPTSISIEYHGHEAPVTCIAVSPSGHYLITGDEQGLAIIWQVSSTRKLQTIQRDAKITCVDWSTCNLIAICHHTHIEIIQWKFENSYKPKSQTLLSQGVENFSGSSSNWQWFDSQSQQYRQGSRIRIKLEHNISHVEFEKSKGDYFVTVCPDNPKSNEVIHIHRISKSASETNFIKGGSIIKKVHFYPRKPQVLILTNSKVVIFNLEKVEKVKHLSAGMNTYSCMSIHPAGGYLLVGTDSQKILCYDLDLSNKPYKTMHYHEKGVVSTAFHQKYPLMSSCSHDSTIHIFHFKVEEQSFSDAVILPLKVLRGHTTVNHEGVRGIKFHPNQPWIFSVGVDHRVLLWT